jgi:hypothetical protein
VDAVGIAPAVQQLLQISHLIEQMQAAQGNAVQVAQLAAFAGIVGGTVYAVRRLGDAVNEATENLRGFARLQANLAGTIQETAAARLLGRVGGFDAGALGERIHQASLHGVGLIAAQQLGLEYRPMEIGTATDRAQMLLRAVEGLQKMMRDPRYGMAGAQLAARRLGVEELIPMAQAFGPREMAQLKALQEEQAKLYTPERVIQAERFRLQVERLGATFETFKQRAVQPMLPLLGKLTEAASLYVRAHPMFHLVTLLDRLFSPHGRGNTPIDQNTQALRENTLSVRDLAQGMFGGGPRARTALPGAFGGAGGGFFLSDALKSGALKFGAYSVGL